MVEVRLPVQDHLVWTEEKEVEEVVVMENRRDPMRYLVAPQAEPWEKGLEAKVKETYLHDQAPAHQHPSPAQQAVAAEEVTEGQNAMTHHYPA
jgi:hypothetical protein